MTVGGLRTTCLDPSSAWDDRIEEAIDEDDSSYSSDVRDALPGIALIAVGLFLGLFPKWNAEATAQTQRGWISILPWLKRRDPDVDWMTDVSFWRFVTRLFGVVLIVVGFWMMLQA